MNRRVFFGLVLAAMPVKALASNRLQAAITELEKATRAAYGNIEFEAAIEETDRSPLLILARRA